MTDWTRRVDNANTRTHPPTQFRAVHPLICLLCYCYCWGWIGLNWRSKKNQPYTPEWWLRIVIIVACSDYFPVSSVQATIPVQWQRWKIVKIIWLIIIIMCPHQDLHYNKLTDDYSNTTPASNHPHNRHRSRLSDSSPPPRDELCAMEQARIMQSLTWTGRALPAWQAAQQTQDHHPGWQERKSQLVYKTQLTQRYGEI